MNTNKNYLDRLSNLDDWKVEDNDKDVRGWEFVTQTGEKIGEVEDLIANTSVEKVVYLGVELDEEMNQFRADELKKKVNPSLQNYFGNEQDKKILVPVGVVELDEENHKIIASSTYNKPHFSSSPRVKDYTTEILTPASELALMDYYTIEDENYNQYRTEESINRYSNREIMDEENFYDNELYRNERYFSKK